MGKIIRGVVVLRDILKQSIDSRKIKRKFIFSFISHYLSKNIFGKKISNFPPMKIKLYDCIFKTRPNTIDFWAVWIEFERDITEYLLKKHKGGMTLVDIGANIGRYSIILAKKGWDVYSFEPVKDTFNQLKINAENNSLGNNIKMYNLGLGSKREKRNIYYDKYKHGEASILEPSDGKRREEIQIEALDNLFKEKIRGKVILKIDVEGFELEVLKGAKKFIETNSPELIIEIWEKNKKIYEKYLHSLGYKNKFGELWIKKY